MNRDRDEHHEPTDRKSDIGERITGSPAPQDPDGLLTVEDLPDSAGETTDLDALLDRATEYGDSVPPDRKDS